MKRIAKVLLAVLMVFSLFSAFASAKTVHAEDETYPYVSYVNYNTYGFVGKEVELKVNASGGNLKYQWYYWNTSKSIWSKSSGTGSTTDTLTVKVTGNPGDSKEYKCEVSNSVGSSSTTMYIRTLGFTQQPEEIYMYLGNRIYSGDTYTWAGYYCTEGLTAQWQVCKDGSTWKNISGASATAGWGGSTSYALRGEYVGTKATASKDGYKYRLRLTYEGKTCYSDAVTLHVVNITNSNKWLVVKTGGTVKPSVTVTGGSSYTYQWQYYTQEVDEDGYRYGVWKNSGLTGNKTNTLTVKGKLEPMKEFRCAVTVDGKKTYYSDRINVYTLLKPTVKITKHTYAENYMQISDGASYSGWDNYYPEGGTYGYAYYRSTSEDGTFVKVPYESMFVEYTADGYVEFERDIHRKSNTNYYYKARAYRTDDNGKTVWGDYSDVVLGKTALKPSVSSSMTISSGNVSKYSVKITNNGTKTIKVTWNKVPYVSLDGDGVDVTYYSDSACTKEITYKSIAAGKSATIYAKLEYTAPMSDRAATAFNYTYDGCSYGFVVQKVINTAAVAAPELK